MVTSGALGPDELDIMRAFLSSEWADGNVTADACMRLLHRHGPVQHPSDISGPQEPANPGPARGHHLVRRWAEL
jgi:hypothetical protein